MCENSAPPAFVLWHRQTLISPQLSSIHDQSLLLSTELRNMAGLTKRQIESFFFFGLIKQLVTQWRGGKWKLTETPGAIMVMMGGYSRGTGSNNKNIHDPGCWRCIIVFLWRMIQKSKSDLVEFKVELWWEYSHPSYNSGTGCYLLLRGYSVAQCHDVILLSGYHFSNAPWGPTGPNLFFLLLQWNSKHVGWCWGSEVSTRGWWCSLCSPAPYTQQPLLSIGLCFNKKKKMHPLFFFFFPLRKTHQPQ